MLSVKDELEYKLEQLRLMLESEEKTSKPYGAHLSHWAGHAKDVNIDVGALKVLIEYYEERLEAVETAKANEPTYLDLRQVLVKYDETGKGTVRIGQWRIATGGYDLWWQLYKDNIPIIDCVASGVYANGEEQGMLVNDCLPSAEFAEIAEVIMAVYPDCILQESSGEVV